jgi:hypothetical protein
MVTFDENFKCVSISTFGGKDQARFFVLMRDIPQIGVTHHSA